MLRPDDGGHQSQNTYRSISCVLRSLVYIKRRQFGLTLTLISVAIILSFIVMEFLDYWLINIDTLVIIDHSWGEKLTVHLNVTYPRVSRYRAHTVYHSFTAILTTSRRSIVFFFFFWIQRSIVSI